MGTPTDLYDAWVADTFGVDPRKYPVKPLVTGFGGDAPTISTPPQQAGPPISDQDAGASCLITVTNTTKSPLKLLRQGHEFGDFMSFPASAVPAGSSTSCVSTHTPHARTGQQGCKGFLEWAIQPADGRGSTLAVWRIEWSNPIGEKNSAAATLAPPSAGFGSLEQIGQGDENVPVVFTLSAGAAATAPPPSTALHKVEVKIHNATDGMLRLDDQSFAGMKLDTPVPASIPAKQTASFAFHGPDWIGGGILYQLVPPGATDPPPNTAEWQIKWHIEPGPKLDAVAELDDKSGAFTSGVQTDGVGAITFELSGTSPPSLPPRPRIEIGITNQTDQALRYLSSHGGGQFESPLPDSIAPGATVSLAIVGSSATGANIIYQLVPKSEPVAEPENIPWWTLAWERPASQKLKPMAELDPRVEGITSTATTVGDAGISFALAGKAASAPATKPPPPPQQPPPPQPEQRTDITLNNATNMMLRRAGADRTTAKFSRMPPDEIAPGATAAFATFTQAKEVEAGLMYAIVPADGAGPGGSPKDANPPLWVVNWTATPGQQPFPRDDVLPRMLGIRSGARADDNSVLFVLSGQWDPQLEQKFNVSIDNQTACTLRLLTSDASGARFASPAPQQIAPGATVSFETSSKGATTPKLSYQVVPKDGGTEGAAKVPVWIIGWQTRPGLEPVLETSVEDSPELIGESELIGDDRMSFALAPKLPGQSN